VRFLGEVMRAFIVEVRCGTTRQENANVQDLVIACSLLAVEKTTHELFISKL
jgi:hypothetical protein